jgi:parallel beta-helix repeat protein
MIGLSYRVQTVEASGTIYIRTDGSIDPPTAPIATLDNVTYTLTGSIYDEIVVERNNVVVDGAGFTVQGTGSGTGIDLAGRSNLTVKNTNIKGFYMGISLSSSSNNTISGNNITTNKYEGIYLADSNYNSISGNNITNNPNWGILFGESSDYNSISENTITENRIGIELYSSYNSISGNTFTGDGLVCQYSPLQSHTNSVENNTVNGKPLVYLEDVTDYSVGDAGQVILVNCDNIRVENLNMPNTSVGVQLLRTNNTLISRNNVTASTFGISLFCSFNNSISGNNFANNEYGVELFYNSSNNLINGNNITTNNSHGIFLKTSANNNSISQNTLTNNRYGIETTWESSYNGICGNNIINNEYGIVLGGASNNSSVCGNNITDNENGIRLETTADNIIYHNNFDNALQVDIALSGYLYPNALDDGYPSGGNYWSNYNGTDADHDGIGDTEYSIVTNNTDYYPLMGMFNSYNVTYYTPPIVPHACNVTVISNSTISDFVAPIWIEHPEVIFLQFNVSGAEGSNGFCRVSFPTAMMNGTYHVSLNGTEIPYTLLPCSDANTSYLYFNYTHSTQEVIIIQEFPSFLILPLFFIATLLAVIAARSLSIHHRPPWSPFRYRT